MCLLTYYPEGSMPDTAALARGAQVNSDGHGYAIISGEEIIVRKSMKPDLLIEEFESMRSKYPGGPALFHSRIGTAGSTNKFNCHPFMVGGDPRTIVAHNGIMPQSMQPRKGDRRCDTRIFAELHLPQRNLNSIKGRRKLGHWLGTDKVVVLTVDPSHNQRAYLINEQYGQWDTATGAWYSNSSHEVGYGYNYGPGWSSYLAWHRDPLTGKWTRDQVDPSAFKCWSHKHGIHLHYSEYVQKGCEGCYIADDVREDDWFPHATGRPLLLVQGTADVTTRGGTVTIGPASSTQDLVPATSLTTRRNQAECIICSAYGTISIVTAICVACLSCQECGGATDEKIMSSEDSPCQCYVPAALRGLDRDLGEDAAGQLDDPDREAIEAAISHIFSEDDSADTDLAVVDVRETEEL